MSNDPRPADQPADRGQLSPFGAPSRTDTRLRWSDPFMPTFVQLLANVLLVSVINFTVWFAITFFVYLETRSVFATGMIAGIFLVATMLTGIWFGSLVDHHSTKAVMQGSALASLVLYAAVAQPAAGAVTIAAPDAAL